MVEYVQPPRLVHAVGPEFQCPLGRAGGVPVGVDRARLLCGGQQRRAGAVRFLRRPPVLGDGQNLAELTCVENVVDALLLCAEAPETVLGRTFNITNGEPMKLWEMVRKLCGLLGYPAPRWRVSLPAALALAGAIEAIYGLVLPRREPPLTRFAVRGLALDATLDIRAARRDLGYMPRVSVDEGLRAFARWWQAAHP